ncbi:MAG: cache domain-containing protein, partial [Anaerolineales bacterium]|nr:cache domain-containing protein [Anaerolineales bacterium]
MKAFPSLQSIPIHTRIIGMLTLISILAVGGTVLSSVYTTREISGTTQQLSGGIVKEQVTHSLISLNHNLAVDTSRMLEKTAQDVEFLAQYVLDIWTKPEQEEMNWAKDEVIVRGENGQYLNSKRDVSSVFLPNHTSLTSQVQEEIEKSRYLDLVFESVQRGNPDIAAIYFATPNNLTRYYPNIDLGNVVPPDFTPIGRPWFIAAVENSKPTANVVWSTIYLDATGLGLVSTASRAVYDHGKLIGVIGVDLLVQDILANVEESFELKSGYNFIINDQGFALALPRQGYLDILERQPAEGEELTNLRDTRNEFLPIIVEMRRGNSGVKEVNIGSRNLIVAYSAIPNVRWSIGSVVDAASYLQPLSDLESTLQTSTQRLIIVQILPLSAAVLV